MKIVLLGANGQVGSECRRSLSALGELVCATRNGALADGTPCQVADFDHPATLGDLIRTIAPDAPQVEILAARPAWVRVSAADGTVILEKTLDAGERFALPKTEQPPKLRTGNSGAVYFAVNGQTYGPAAPGAQVLPV